MWWFFRWTVLQSLKESSPCYLPIAGDDFLNELLYKARRHQLSCYLHIGRDDLIDRLTYTAEMHQLPCSLSISRDDLLNRLSYEADSHQFPCYLPIGKDDLLDRLPYNAKKSKLPFCLPKLGEELLNWLPYNVERHLCRAIYFIARRRIWGTDLQKWKLPTAIIFSSSLCGPPRCTDLQGRRYRADIQAGSDRTSSQLIIVRTS